MTSSIWLPIVCTTDHGDLGAANIAYLLTLRVEPGQVDELLDLPRTVTADAAVIEDLPADDLAWCRDDAQDRLSGHALSAAALAHHAQGLATLDAKGGAVYGADEALWELKIGLDIF
jgi:hypothetical protein